MSKPTDTQSIDTSPREDARRMIPPVHDLTEKVMHMDGMTSSQALVAEAARSVLDEYRAQLETDDNQTPLDDETLAQRVQARMQQMQRSPLMPVINATGIILHTGLGRSPLAEVAAKAAADAAANYAPVELDMKTGDRGRRSHVVRDLLCELTGAESATVVNNNAAALLLTLNTIARDRHVIVSRGELIEIGGSFRLPEIMTISGTMLKEVGTTNRTRIGDYHDAIDDKTAALLKVHTSNFRVRGFTESVSIETLAKLGQSKGMTVIDDIGSGALKPTKEYGWSSDEPDATTSIAAGAEIVMFSGDKLLGGPQAGIIIGKRCWIDNIESNPLMRTFRVDKITLAALGATLQLHRDPKHAAKHVPVLSMLTMETSVIKRRCESLVQQLEGCEGIAQIEIRETESYLGGGSGPEETLPSAAMVIRPEHKSETQFADILRKGDPAIVARIHDGAIWFDLRTVREDQDKAMQQAILNALK